MQNLGSAFGASGAGHSSGFVPDPGGSSGTAKFLREDATWQTPSGGGGNVTYSSAVASPPGSPSSGDLWLPSDGGGVLFHYSGSAWVPYGPAYPFTDPTAAGLNTWLNQGSAAVDSSKGVVTLYRDGTDAVSVHARIKTAPSTPYVISTALSVVATGTFTEAGIIFHDSAGGALNHFCMLCGTNSVYIRQYASATSLTSNATSFTWEGRGGPMFLQIADDGVNRKYRVSSDGVNWLTMYSEGRTTGFTANRVGLAISAYAGPVSNSLLSWKET